MNAAETIQAAINLLEDFKKSSTPGDWAILDGGDRFIAWHDDPASTGFEYIVAEPVEFENPVDAALITVLHRTIDAELDFLRTARSIAGAQITGELAELVVGHGEQFARAVLGEVPDAS